MANEEVYLSNIEHKLDQIKKLLESIVDLLTSMDATLEEVEKKN